MSLGRSVALPTGTGLEPPEIAAPGALSAPAVTDFGALRTCALFETEGSPQHRHVEPLRLRLPCFVMLDRCQQEIEPLARRPFPPGILARREAAQGRDLLVGWRGRLPGRYVSPPNREVRDSDPLGPR